MMKWNVKDLEMFEQAKEYVDTAIVPLMPIAFTEKSKELSSMREFLSILSMELERTFKGRIFLVPAYHYIHEDKFKLTALKHWEIHLHKEFKHVIFLTSDHEWKQDESELVASLIWIPSIPLELLEMDQARELIKKQCEQMIDIITKKWE